MQAALLNFLHTEVTGRPTQKDWQVLSDPMLQDTSLKSFNTNTGNRVGLVLQQVRGCVCSLSLSLRSLHHRSPLSAVVQDAVTGGVPRSAAPGTVKVHRLRRHSRCGEKHASGHAVGGGVRVVVA